MNPPVTSVESKKFVQILLGVGLVWMGLGVLLNADSFEQVLAFLQIYLFTALDLVFLMLLFWTLFFSRGDEKMRRSNKIRVMLFSFFKLVCLAFLAITLKRLRNASTSTLFMGVGFIWVGPLVSGLILKYISRK